LKLFRQAGTFDEHMGVIGVELPLYGSLNHQIQNRESSELISQAGTFDEQHGSDRR
jgi:hypothetical protein